MASLTWLALSPKAELKLCNDYQSFLLEDWYSSIKDEDWLNPVEQQLTQPVEQHNKVCIWQRIPWLVSHSFYCLIQQNTCIFLIEIKQQVKRNISLTKCLQYWPKYSVVFCQNLYLNSCVLQKNYTFIMLSFFTYNTLKILRFKKGYQLKEPFLPETLELLVFQQVLVAAKGLWLPFYVTQVTEVEGKIRKGCFSKQVLTLRAYLLPSQRALIHIRR